MAQEIGLHNDLGKLKIVKLGFSWSVFIFGFFFGIPLFLRRLYWQGVILAALMAIYYYILFSISYLEIAGIKIFVIFGSRVSETELITILASFLLISLAITFYFAKNANRWFAEDLISNGYLPVKAANRYVEMLSNYISLDYSKFVAKVECAREDW